MKKVGTRAVLKKGNQTGNSSKFAQTTVNQEADVISEPEYAEPLAPAIAHNPVGALQAMPSAEARQNVFRSLASNYGNAAAGQIARQLSSVQRAPATKAKPKPKLTLEQQMGLLSQWYGEYIQEASKQYGVGVDELSAIIATEVRGELSKGSKEGMAIASSGAAFGVMQLTKGTWEDVQNNHKELAKYDFSSNWKNPQVNILFGAAALAGKKTALHSKGMLGKDAAVTDEMAFVAYNAGQGTVKIAYKAAVAAGSKQPQIDYLKPEYLKKAIEDTKIYTYYSKRGHTVAESIELKYKEITQYPDLAKERLQAMKGAKSNNPPKLDLPKPSVEPTTPKTEPKPEAPKAIFSPEEEQSVMEALRKALAGGKKDIAAVDAGYYEIRPDHKINPSDKKAVAEWKYIHSTLLPKVKASVKPEAAKPAATPAKAATPATQTGATTPKTTEPAAGEPDALDKLVGLAHQTPHYTAEQIKQARDLIVQEKNATKRGELFLLLQGKVEYHNQRNNASTGGTNLDAENNRTGKKIGDVMCNLTSLAMALETLGISNPEPDKYPQYEDYLEHVGRDKYGKKFARTGDWQGVASAMGAKVTIIGSGYLKKSWWETKALPKLQEGNGMMMSITGHIVRVQDVHDDGLIIDDPYGKVDLKEGTGWGYKGSKNAADSESGKGVIGENSVWAWNKVEKHSMKWVGVVSKSK